MKTDASDKMERYRAGIVTKKCDKFQKCLIE